MPEEEVDTNEKGPYIFQSEVEKFIKEMRNMKATGDDDDVPGQVLKLLGECGLKIMTKLINTIYMNWRVAQGLHRSYDCLKEDATNYKMQ